MPGTEAQTFDAVVVGAGPNGLAAAVTLAREGYAVKLIEAADTVGGGARSAALTRPGFVHDVCSAIHPMAAASPAFRTMDLGARGLDWIHPTRPLAHPLDDGPAVLLDRSLDATAAGLGPDGPAWKSLIGPLVDAWDTIVPDLLGPVGWPRRPLLYARFGLSALRSAEAVATSRFTGERGRALFAGLAAHSILPLDRAATSAIAIVLAAAGHAVGWPLPRGGSQRIADALAGTFRSLGGSLETGRLVERLDDLPPARATLLDVTPRQLLDLAGDALPTAYRRRLAAWRYGSAVFKVDWALDGPVPWRDPDCGGAGTVHVGGTLEEIAGAEAAVGRGEHPGRPFVLFAQPSRFDDTRAPAGRHTAWAYTHVPRGSTVDMTEPIEAQIERFAPGFRERILERAVRAPADLERENPNLVGGSIDGGEHSLLQTLARPLPGFRAYAVPGSDLYLCSSSTPPGAGVHGMCGYHAARSALRSSFGTGATATR